MRMNWFLAVLGWLAVLAVAVGAIMVVAGQSRGDGHRATDANPAVIYAGAGLLALGPRLRSQPPNGSAPRVRHGETGVADDQT